MSTTELLQEPSSYRDIAELHGRRALYYQAFGSYQGEWLMLAISQDGKTYYVYKGWYGSCSGCDDLEARFNGYYGSKPEANSEQQAAIREFADQYRPFAEIPRDTARALVLAGTLEQVLPANTIGNVPAAAIEIEAVIALEENLAVDEEFLLKVMNLETRRRLAERFGIPALVREVIATEEGSEDRLVRLSDGELYLHLHDGTTEREYLLCVPPEMERVRQAKAWSFNLDEDDYHPEIET